MELLWPGLLILQMFCFINGYPNGAPSGACEDMLPRHSGVLPQPSPAPYTILTNARVFQPGKPITVTIVGPKYRGVLLEARIGGGLNAVGTWQRPPPDTKFLQCAHNPRGAVTHSNTNLKGNSTVYSWIPPNCEGPVYFMATVAQQRTVFWVNIRSMDLTRGKTGGLDLAVGASAGMAEGKPLLPLVICFLILNILA
ncbi:putative defense protein Hdd11 [Maylandia zebra]|uniref:Si:dkey-251i10.2 n=2 Tax=Haplochromini TaxID=319058 RepID=A0A3P9DQ34_9CICH|nr:reelin domain-containing protein 1 [Maylandia zebra]XP_026044391.1 putative defense protein Hdd11 [Astatotilapia calliptera]XP_026044615.1 putative defense protein Hdd11 [Astatotilapia calliptera]